MCILHISFAWGMDFSLTSSVVEGTNSLGTIGPEVNADYEAESLYKNPLVIVHSKWKMHQTNVNLYGHYIDILINLISFSAILISIGMFYKTSLLTEP